MAFEPKPNTGVLWPNEKKQAENHPDFRGDIFIDLKLLKDLAPKAENGLLKISIAGWRKELAGKKCLSISASAPYVKPAAVQEDFDQSIPF